MKTFLLILQTVFDHPYNKQRPMFAIYRTLRWYFNKILQKEYFLANIWGYEIQTLVRFKSIHVVIS